MEQEGRTESSKVVVQVNQNKNQNGELDLINVFSNMGKRKRLIAYLLALAILVGASVGALYSGFEHISGKGSYARAMITFQFDGIENGLDPNGAAFDVNLIRSPYVIQAALLERGYDESYVETVRENLSIDGVIPKDALERITVIKNMAQKESKYYEQLLDVSYFPSEYILYLYDDGTFNSKELPKILDGIIDSYKQYFMDTYANTEVLSVTSNLLSGDDYDYGESIDLVTTQMDIMLSYVRERMKTAPDFRASSTGLSFQDIVTSLEFVKTVDINRLSSYIQSQSLTKDKYRQQEYYEYMIRNCSNKISELQTRLDSLTNTINSYEKDPVVIVSNSDSTLEYGQKNEYYDSLVTEKENLIREIAHTNTNLNQYYLLLSQLSESGTSANQEAYDYADSLLNRLNTTISSWVELIEETTQEYYSTTLFSNAVKKTVPAQYVVDGGVTHIIKNIAIPSAILVVLVLIWWYYTGVKEEILTVRKKAVEKE
ncbi:hypothetical protein [Butyrivibrio sp. MC2021]|uniref:hypothetical protein n=1 Tax=Butyrivibrio sp. MC2021 TaxID=1408306 RepID=UPI00047949FB|nr:hypothetical protein [Butyrivibrio sp. MC2021]